MRGAVTGPLAALMLTLSIAVPLVERADFVHETVVESHHDPAQCPSAHNHTVCTQVSANQVAPARSAKAPVARWARQFVLCARVESAKAAFDIWHAPARAPPTL